MEWFKIYMQLYDGIICGFQRDTAVNQQMFSVGSTVPLTWTCGDIAKWIEAFLFTRIWSQNLLSVKL